ncbi:MAG: hypothetical protein ACRDPM_20510 [Solirubrobacteraceae bacterium]
MAPDIEIDEALSVLTATLNDQRLDHFDAGRVQQIVTSALRGEPALTVDDGGGLHDEQGVRIGAVRRTDSGEWIADRQNEAAMRSDTAIPSASSQNKLRALLSKLKVPGR